MTLLVSKGQYRSLTQRSEYFGLGLSIVLVLWENHDSEEATRELRDQVLKKYPHLLLEVC